MSYIRNFGDVVLYDISVCTAREIDRVDIWNNNTVYLDEYRGITYDLIMNQRYDLNHNGVNLIIYNIGKARYGLPVNRLSPYYGKTVNIEGFVNHRGILTNYESPLEPMYQVVCNFDKPIIWFFKSVWESFRDGFWPAVTKTFVSYFVRIIGEFILKWGDAISDVFFIVFF